MQRLAYFTGGVQKGTRISVSRINFISEFRVKGGGLFRPPKKYYSTIKKPGIFVTEFHQKRYCTVESIENIYQRKNPVEHVLLRPDTYIGSIEKTTTPGWVIDPESIKESATSSKGSVYSNCRIIRKDCTYVPGLYKIFDEILVNAADNKQRDQSTSEIRVDVNIQKGT